MNGDETIEDINTNLSDYTLNELLDLLDININDLIQSKKKNFVINKKIDEKIKLIINNNIISKYCLGNKRSIKYFLNNIYIENI